MTHSVPRIWRCAPEGAKYLFLGPARTCEPVLGRTGAKLRERQAPFPQLHTRSLAATSIAGASFLCVRADLFALPLMQKRKPLIALAP